MKWTLRLSHFRDKKAESLRDGRERCSARVKPTPDTWVILFTTVFSKGEVRSNIHGLQYVRDFRGLRQKVLICGLNIEAILPFDFIEKNPQNKRHVQNLPVAWEGLVTFRLLASNFIGRASFIQSATLKCGIWGSCFITILSSFERWVTSSKLKLRVVRATGGEQERRVVGVGSESPGAWHPAEHASAPGGTNALVLALSICFDC